jgi:hypothetical protein
MVTLKEKPAESLDVNVLGMYLLSPKTIPQSMTQ